MTKAPTQERTPTGVVMYIPLEKVAINPYQHRVELDQDHAAELAKSIKEIGRLVQTPVGRWTDKRAKKVELAAGAHRLAAYKLLAAEKWLPAAKGFPVICEDLSDQDMFALGVVENVARKSLSPIDEANAIKIAREEFDLPFDQIADLLGHGSASTVKNKLRLLDLPTEITDRIHIREITEGNARLLLSMLKVQPIHKVKGFAKRAIKPDATPARITEQALGVIAGDDGVKTLWGTWDTGNTSPARGGAHLWPLTWKPKPAKQSRGLLSPTKFLDKNRTWDSLDNIYPTEIKARSVDPEATPKKAIKGIFQTLTGERELPGGALSDDFLADTAFELGVPLELVEFLEHFRSPPTCSACPFHTKINGVHSCGQPLCWKIKRKAWIELELQRISKETWIPVYNPKIDGSVFEAGVFRWYRNDADEDRKRYFKAEVDKVAIHKDTPKEEREPLTTDLRLKAISNQNGKHDFTGSALVAVISVRHELAVIKAAAGEEHKNTRRVDHLVDDEGGAERRREIGNFHSQITKAWIKYIVCPMLAPVIEKKIDASILHLVGAQAMNYGLDPEDMDGFDSETLEAKINHPLWAQAIAWAIIAWAIIEEDVDWQDWKLGPEIVYPVIEVAVAEIGLKFTDKDKAACLEFCKPEPEIAALIEEEAKSK